MSDIEFPTESDTLVIACHGFLSSPESNTVTGCCQAVNKRGLAAVSLDFCPNTGENMFRQMNISEMRGKLNAKIEECRPKYKSIFLLGSSLGATLALLAAVEESVEGVIDIAGPTTLDIEAKLRPQQVEDIKTKGSSTWQHKGAEEIFTISKQFFDECKEVNILKEAPKIKCPVLILHGSEDTTVPAKVGEDLFFRLACPKDFVVIGGGGHRFLEEQPKNAMISAVVNWLDRTNK